MPHSLVYVIYMYMNILFLTLILTLIYIEDPPISPMLITTYCIYTMAKVATWQFIYTHLHRHVAAIVIVKTLSCC